MCFHSKQSKSAQELENRFKAEFEHSEAYNPAIYNGFGYPKTPVITNADPKTIQMYHWGLLPKWAKTSKDPIRSQTLNARVETITEKPAFRNSIDNRCLILLDGFFEWEWLDEKGKNKQKYLITIPNEAPFAMAGLFNQWTDKSTGEILNTYTIITQEANELMDKIHNTKKRMPVILTPEYEKEWLVNGATNDNKIELVATKI